MESRLNMATRPTHFLDIERPGTGPLCEAEGGANSGEPTLDAERRQCASFRPFKRTELSAYFVP
jgi:hypothetical protein